MRIHSARRSPRRAAIVDEFTLQRQRLGELVNSQRASVVFSGASPRQLMDWMQSVDQTEWPHVIVVTVLSERTLADALSVIGALHTAGVRVLAVAHPDSMAIRRALADSDVHVVVSASDGDSDFAEAITAVLEGRRRATNHSNAALVLPQGRPRLSVQESRLLALYASGLTVADAATRIGVQHNTARKYLARVRDKYTAAGYQARTKLELARLAYEDGYLIP